jgi:RNA polymerase sigma-70 factor (ECF subfamily)
VLSVVIVTAPIALAPTLDFDAFFRRHYGPLVRALTLASGNPDVAADAVQDAFVRAHVRWRRLKDYDDPASWVRRVAINRVRDHFRHEHRGLRVRQLLASSSSDHQPGPEPPSDLGRVLCSLPAQQRIALSLYYIGELTVAEVATAMRLSPGTVKFHLHEGRRRLRPLLGAGDHDD